MPRDRLNPDTASRSVVDVERQLVADAAECLSLGQQTRRARPKSFLRRPPRARRRPSEPECCGHIWRVRRLCEETGDHRLVTDRANRPVLLHGPEFVRLGVRSERRANASTSARAPAATSLAARVAAVVAETRLLQTMLEEAAACPDDASRKLYRRCDTNQHPPQPIAVRRTSGRCSLDAFRTARSAGVPADRRNRRCSPPFDA